FPDSGRGAYRFRYFTLKMVHRSLRMKQSNMFLNCSQSMDLTFGLKKKLKNCYRKDLLLNTVQMASLQKKQILWTFGSIQALLMKLFYCSVKITIDRRMSI